MPVIEIRALRQSDEVDVERVLAEVTRGLAALLGEDPSGSWATWEEIPPGRYSEGGEAPDVQPLTTHPPLVRVIAFEGRSAAVIGTLLTTVAEILARELGVEPGNVFARYEEQSSGRLYTGGGVR